MTLAKTLIDAIVDATTETAKPISLIALTSHDVNLLTDTTPVKEIEVQGRKTLIFDGVNLEDHILVRIPRSGLPVPTVKDTSAEVTNKTLLVQTESKTVEIQVSVSKSAGKQIVDLPEAQEGIGYITSSFTANTALLQGRTDVYAPKQIVCTLNSDGSTTIVGTLGIKLGG